MDSREGFLEEGTSEVSHEGLSRTQQEKKGEKDFPGRWDKFSKQGERLQSVQQDHSTKRIVSNGGEDQTGRDR